MTAWSWDEYPWAVVKKIRSHRPKQVVAERATVGISANNNIVTSNVSYYYLWFSTRGQVIVVCFTTWLAEWNNITSQHYNMPLEIAPGRNLSATWLQYCFHQTTRTTVRYVVSECIFYFTVKTQSNKCFFDYVSKTRLPVRRIFGYFTRPFFPISCRKNIYFTEMSASKRRRSMSKLLIRPSITGFYRRDFL